MCVFIQAWSGQSGSGFVPHSPAPLALPPPPADALPAAVVFPASAPAFSVGAADALAAALALGSADAVVAADADALAVGAALADASGALAEPVGLLSVVSDFVQATINAASERRTGNERMGGELTRK